jgi:hypothetical protein
MSWTIGIRGFDSRWELGIFFFSSASRPALEPSQPPIQWVPGVNRPRREGDHSPASTAEVKNAWRYTSTPHSSPWHGAWLSTETFISHLLPGLPRGLLPSGFQTNSLYVFLLSSMRATRPTRVILDLITLIIDLCVI